MTLPSAEELARYSLACQRLLPWATETERLATLADEHAFDLQLAMDMEIAAKRAEHFALGLPPEAYLNRWVQISDDMKAMLSIRFMRMDVTQPFVDVSVTTRPVKESDFRALREAAQREYGPFKPPRLRFWHAGDMHAFPGTTTDMRALAAPITELRGHPIPQGLTLVATRDDTRYSEAQAAYAAVESQHPAHTGQAALCSLEDLQECIEARTMFDILWNGVWSGYAGTLSETKHGLPVQTVQELILTSEARGHGLGAALSTLLAQHLPADGRVLYGTIHGENSGARKAALNAGRHDIGGWNWLSM